VNDICQKLLEARVVPVLRFETAALTERAVQCLQDVGFEAVEITMTTPDAFSLIRKFSGKMLVGAGTVLDEKTAKGCLDAGAQFLVAPFVFPEMVTISHQAGKAALLGGFTPTEVLAAQRAGADIVKVFPASSGGPAHLAALHSVYPEVRLCPTGGVSRDNMEKYFAAGAALVGVGNAIVPLAALKSGDLDAVRAHAAAYLGRSFT
jgi:2-dehydro-3-deoxyphosphogluconate aldolase / (4S)-4-hydroxy-2-oxoglutarate aldolase